ncbi:sugar MFS transporter [Neisseria dumasiana]|uniref:Glucose/galactose MFS transporter n=1 Tax=Neisseria dumasiana TaxID=1931275 RepID=A0A1X3DJ88_9NEIS|nr:sugar MFS transporter [Neisseria dumasiana]OSI17588.1 glucose/galactose MFS transporter [Neisseria dumasiana]OSI22782.1 glucose/galactose MFS transporter [Neisseria dumasiana]OSI35783.1 glucose/galactose MFS transporter [Neisseria dumasiana]UOO85353.1 sugar MFS transporter [Neisseria dumasiana]
MSTQSQTNNNFALSVLTTLFFMMGFITCMNDILIPHLKSIFNLTYTQAMLIQFCFFAAYAVMSIPMGKLVEKVGYKNGVIGGFLIAALGCFLFYPAAGSHSYPIFLGALFVLASGIVLLQVAGNPYVTLMAKPGKESSTLTLIQAFNSLATMIAPPLGAMLIFVDATASEAERISSVQIPYLGLAGFLILLAVVVKMLHLPDARKIAEEVTEHNHDGKTSVWQYKHMVLGAAAIFCYVGAEVAIGSLMINVLEEVAGLNHSTGAFYLSFYWGGAMVGRFIGSAMMNKIAPNKYLTFNALAAIALIIIAISAGGGAVTQWALLGIGFFNSIMFPTIFSLATKGLGKFTGAASGIICTAIVGGAIVPVVQGFFADNAGLLVSFIVPAICYMYITFFATKGYKADEVA